ncbi:MAG TPA: hypothetical protein VN836_08740 [Verrucomicrobiae bacterium]|nr:hypothetical protein [Verrucomicrobiae bacterium]
MTTRDLQRTCADDEGVVGCTRGACAPRICPNERERQPASVNTRSIFAIERGVRHRPCNKIASSGALNAGKAIATVAAKIKILAIIQTAASF